MSSLVYQQRMYSRYC